MPIGSSRQHPDDPPLAHPRKENTRLTGEMAGEVRESVDRFDDLNPFGLSVEDDESVENASDVIDAGTPGKGAR